MASFVASMVQGLATHEALSGVFGSISLAAWVFLLVPQVIENYRQGSAEGISLAFLVVWFIGDITNLVGALWAGLVPTVIALAVYFCFADVVLISQVLYYNIANARKANAARRKAAPRVEAPPQEEGGEGANNASAPSEEQPLLARIDSRSSNLGLPGSHRRSSVASRRRRASSLPSFGAGIIEDDAASREWVTNALSIVGVCIVGATGWVIAWRTGVWVPTMPAEDAPAHEVAVGAQMLGYASAVCYLGARIPQIIKNQKQRSCEGLSLLFFMLSLLGNATYGAGIIFHSTERKYFLINLPWLIGSLGTMVEDVTIFIQFRVFGNEGGQTAAIE